MVIMEYVLGLLLTQAGRQLRWTDVKNPALGALQSSALIHTSLGLGLSLSLSNHLSLHASEPTCSRIDVLGSPADGSVSFARDVSLGSLGLRAWDWYSVFSHFLVRLMPASPRRGA